MSRIIEIISFGFYAGVGFMVAQDLWWFVTGLLSICRG